MKIVKMKFPGTYAELQDEVRLTGILGEWRDLENCKQFRADNGAILNWWQSTGTITFQGRGSAAAEFEAKLSRAIGGVRATITAEASDAKNLDDPQQEIATLKKLLGDLTIKNAKLKKLLEDAIVKAEEAAKCLLDHDAMQALVAIRRLQKATEEKVRRDCL